MVWAEDADDLRRLATEKKIDVALEWQHGPRDFPVRDMLREIGKQVPLIMSRNWAQGMWQDEAELRSYGYEAALDMPFPIVELRKVCERLSVWPGLF